MSFDYLSPSLQQALQRNGNTLQANNWQSANLGTAYNADNPFVANKSNSDTFTLSEQTPTVKDGKDDGKISLSEKIKNFGKGLISPVTNLFKSPKNFLIGAAMIGAGAGLMAMTGGAAAPVMVALGVTMGTVQFGVGAYKAATARTDTEAETAWEGIGAGTTSVGLSVLGAKSALKAAKVDTTNLNPLQATIECFKKTPSQIGKSFANAKAFFKVGVKAEPTPAPKQEPEVEAKTEPKTTEQKSTAEQTVEPKPTEQKPVEQPKPSEQSKPVEQKPPAEQVKPAEQPVEQPEPAKSKPVEQPKAANTTAIEQRPVSELKDAPLETIQEQIKKRWEIRNNLVRSTGEEAKNLMKQLEMEIHCLENVLSNREIGQALNNPSNRAKIDNYLKDTQLKVNTSGNNFNPKYTEGNFEEIITNHVAKKYSGKVDELFHGTHSPQQQEAILKNGFSADFSDPYAAAGKGTYFGLEREIAEGFAKNIVTAKYTGENVAHLDYNIIKELTSFNDDLSHNVAKILGVTDSSLKTQKGIVLELMKEVLIKNGYDAAVIQKSGVTEFIALKPEVVKIIS